ncbi:grass carp reovirus (GCRV)-induced gene 2p [Anabas testudineus]|uniref:PARP catalytic domain-containing protein n=1 Tax=Anabas testudineus TaxID=64144 RepID=A0A7N6F8P9_ANATE|nr:grass carp reovirus (GCRV)-induced gene 2p [Anabas testudineus]XP_026198526.1 grass carp reovirus (GCRV)-induced gene 2p [Anabas testudineus]
MSVQFSGWEVVDDGASFPGVKLGPSQKPQNRGVYTMYHGTSVANARLIIANGFKQSSGGTLGRGVYVSRKKRTASNYPLFGNPSDRVVFMLRVRVGRVKRIDANSLQMQHTWHANGYDTAWIPPSSAPMGLEEDCVFDPKRVEVVGIANAPNTTLEKELQQLIGKRSRRKYTGGGGGGGGGAHVCSLCKRKTQQGAQHVKQQCWKCGKNICILMSKHFCSAKP